MLNYASAGLGSASSIGVELFKAQAGVDIVHVPYRGLPEAHTSVMRGDAALFMTFFSAGGDLIQANRLRPSGVTTANRLAVLPAVPTPKKSGLPALTSDPRSGLLAPAATPKAVITEINAPSRVRPRCRTSVERFTRLGVDLTVRLTLEEFTAPVKATPTVHEALRYGEIDGAEAPVPRAGIALANGGDRS
jgi:tripartite-type tricarboxylate transporter receptor subunit TctC